MNDEPRLLHDELPPQSGPSGFLIAVIVVGVFTVGFSLLFRSAMAPMSSARLGREFPPIEVAGWINGLSPTSADLHGQVTVIDAWADWCGPCRAATPFLIELHEKYKERGVTFLGLTSEGFDPASIKRSQKYVESEKVPWPNGYGAVKTLGALKVDSIPQFWIVDRQNQIVFHEEGWGPNSIRDMEQALNKALGSPVP